ncbi:MAG: efflux RND transporter periplasmic adaptor subunit [Aquisalinus sp.]|nr:efflux RND transporter periplasmic adaptor subunit [Aquisalinus sp.]
MIKNAAIATFCVLALSACGNSSGQNETSASNQRGSAVGVIVHEVTLMPDERVIDVVGTARARQAATIFPQSQGEIITVTFTPGKRVTKGSVLARLENTEERLNEARAKVALQDAEQLLARYERIDVPGAISDSQIDVARTAVEAARIDLELARDALENRIIRAPFSGFVGLNEVDAGARVTPQTVITQLDDRSVLFVDFEVPEQIFGLLAENDTLPMQSFAAQDRNFIATVRSVGSRIDPQRRSFVIRAEIDNKDDQLRPGMSFRVNFATEGQRLPAVPEAAILWGGDGAYLWTANENMAERVPVSLVSRSKGYVLLDGPLEAGDLVIAEGVQKVRSGSNIEIVGRTNNELVTSGRVRAVIGNSSQ